MKQLKLLSILLTSLSFSQEVETIQIGKSDQYLLASIEGISKGEIPFEKLGSLSGLHVREPYRVVSFKIEYPSGSSFKSIQLLSNLIPDSILLDIRKSCLKEEVFFTDIKVQTPENKLVLIDSISLIPILKEDE